MPQSPPGTVVQPGASIVPTGQPTAGTPAGGAIGEVLGKASAADYDVAWLPAPPAAIPGGGNQRVLTKQSATDNDYAWGGDAHFDGTAYFVGNARFETAARFGSEAVSAPNDLSRHIKLWEDPASPDGTNGFGLSMTGGKINLVAASANARVQLASYSQPQISDPAGANARDIIDTTNGDARYLLKSEFGPWTNMTPGPHGSNVNAACRLEPGAITRMRGNFTGVWNGSVDTHVLNLPNASFHPILPIVVVPAIAYSSASGLKVMVYFFLYNNGQCWMKNEQRDLSYDQPIYFDITFSRT